MDIKNSPSSLHSPVSYNCSQSALPLEHGQLYLPSSYVESHHEYSAMTFYSPAVMNYSIPSSASNAEGEPGRQAMAPNVLWPTPGHLSPLAIHCQSSLLYAEPPKSPWGEAKSLEHTLPVTRETLKRKPRTKDSSVPTRWCSLHVIGGSWEPAQLGGGGGGESPVWTSAFLSGSRRERCGYRVARRQRHPEEQLHCLSKAKKNGGNVTPVKELPLTPLSPEQLVLTLLEAEPPNVLVSRPNAPFTEASMMMSLTKLADKELVHMIGWAKKIPGFVELSLYDQVRLLESCWMEVLMVGLMWRSINHPGKLIFAPDLILDRDEGKCVEGILEIFDMLLATTSRFRELKLQHKEYLCVKAMVLLNSSMYPLTAATQEAESNQKLTHLLNAVTDALVWVIAKSGISTQQQSMRLANLLMLLSHVRHASNKGMEHLLSMKCKNVVPIYDLLLEMLNAHTLGGHKSSGAEGSSAEEESKNKEGCQTPLSQ
ncbi:estrogen receptor beta [Echinops telfairi]|uniref:Estrogen receptor beta n=1 Tax=Echinops telfairi TaxID=9371 RepID=A0AC55CVP8_ECHTE|nr:estrogen receptor beta [Echinops telfairi]